MLCRWDTSLKAGQVYPPVRSEEKVRSPESVCRYPRQPYWLLQESTWLQNVVNSMMTYHASLQTGRVFIIYIVFAMMSIPRDIVHTSTDVLIWNEHSSTSEAWLSQNFSHWYHMPSKVLRAPWHSGSARSDQCHRMHALLCYAVDLDPRSEDLRSNQKKSPFG